MKTIAELVQTRLPDAADGWPSLRDATRTGIWRYRPSLGLSHDIPEISLGEGDTPIVPLPRWGSAIGLDRAFAKLEYLGPTGSFKDRGAAAVIAVLAGQGFREIVEDSSGNAGAAMAAYAARAGLKARIFVPESAAAAKRAQIGGYGAELVAIQGTREDVAAAAEAAVAADGVAYASHSRHPAFVEGTKTCGLEIAASFASETLDHVVIPVGNGGLLLGIFKAYMELKAAGFSARLPRLHGVQAAVCAPLVTAFDRGSPQPAIVNPRPTVASGVAGARPVRGHEVLAAIRVSGGTVVSVEDDEAQTARFELGRFEGLDLEFTSAIGFAAVGYLRNTGVIRQQEVVVIPATGSGLKDIVV